MAGRRYYLHRFGGLPRLPIPEQRRLALVGDDRGVTLLGVSDRSQGIQVDGGAKGKVARGKATGKLLAEKAKAAGFTRVVFDRAGYRYHGRVKAVADGARGGGLEF